MTRQPKDEYLKRRLKVSFEWSSSNNIDFDDVYQSDNHKYDWVCKEGHIWKASLRTRILSPNKTCPKCSSLGFLKPELAKSFALTNNVDPYTIASQSRFKAKWFCEKCGGTYIRSVQQQFFRVSCPYCNNRKLLTGFNDAKTIFPTLKHWDQVKNNKSLTEIKFNDSEKYWWKCEKDHAWQESLKVQQKSNECPYCLSKNNSLKVKYPQLLSSFLENNSLNPEEIVYNDKGKYYWCCENCSGIYEDTIKRRLFGKCPYCVNLKLLKGFNDLSTKEPIVSKFFDSSKEGRLAEEVLISDKSLFWWQCLTCSRSWKSTIRNVKRISYPCSHCRGEEKYKRINLVKDYPQLCSEFSVLKNSNVDITSLSRTKIVYWECRNGSLHFWRASIQSRIDGKECSICFGRLLKSGINDLKTKSPHLLEYWDYFNNTISPSEVKYDSLKKVWWKCSKGHSFEKEINELQKGNHLCLVCTHKVIVTGINDLFTEYPHLLKEWDFDKNENINIDSLSPSDLKEYYWWKCEKNHSWKAKVRGRAQYNNGCPLCSKRSSKMEKEVYDYIKSIYHDAIQGTKEFTHPYELDIYIPSLRKGLEFNGDYWHSDEVIRQTKANFDTAKDYHEFKYTLCEKNEVNLAFIWESDWCELNNEVKNELQLWLNGDIELSSSSFLFKFNN